LFALIALSLPMYLVGARTAAESPIAPLYLEVRASVRGALGGPFVPEMSLLPSAQIMLQARTSRAARVYMLHCDAHAALSVFPDAGGIDFRADQWVSLPAANMPIQVGNRPGNETVYVIATRDQLAHSDSELAAWLTDNMRQPQAAHCDTKLVALLAGSGAARAPSLPPTAANPPLRKLPYALRGVDVSSSMVARAFAEVDGVVVLRLSYVVVPPL
jgi:hypothetical protein